MRLRHFAFEEVNSHSKPNHAVLREFWKNIFVYTDFFNFKCDFCRYSYCFEYLLDHIAVCEEIGQRKSFLNAIIVNNLMHLGFEVNSYTAYNPDLFIWSNFIKYFFNNLALKIVFEEVNFTLQNATLGCKKKFEVLHFKTHTGLSEELEDWTHSTAL